MIIGLGSDLCNIERIQNSLDRFGARFENRVFTEIERAKATKRPFTRAGTYAKRFAAKEAFSKSLGTGLRAPCTFQNIAVSHDGLGKPILLLADELQAFLTAKNITQTHISVSDEKNLAAAFVVLETAVLQA